jgi:AcrR family transcriptional regulator
VTVRAIAKRARASNGSLYSHFSSKEMLLDYLDELLATELRATFEELPARHPDTATPLEELIRELVAVLIAFHRKNRGLVRALVLRPHGQNPEHRAERIRRRNEPLPEIFALLARYGDAIGHPDPERAITHGFVMIWSSVRERIVFPEDLDPLPQPSDEELTEELAGALLAYLRA